MTYRNINGNCLDEIKKLSKQSVNLVITSPPYADARKNDYGGPAPDKFVDWFLPISEEIKRVLVPTGTFVINIKEKVVSCERHTYVLDLIVELRKKGWLWTEEWIWHKKNCFPGKWPNRFRDAWERCLQFNLQKKFKMNQDQVMVPVGDWAESRLKNLSDTDKTRDNSDSGSSFGKKVANWVGRDMVYPTNVLHFATECGNKNHSAAFPESLPTFFIKLFSDKKDVVLDPFEGSGTTGVAAVKLGRDYIGIDLDAEHTEIASNRIKEALKAPFD